MPEEPEQKSVVAQAVVVPEVEVSPEVAPAVEAPEEVEEVEEEVVAVVAAAVVVVVVVAVPDKQVGAAELDSSPVNWLAQPPWNTSLCYSCLRGRRCLLRLCCWCRPLRVCMRTLCQHKPAPKLISR